MNFAVAVGLRDEVQMRAPDHPLVHLELHTGDLSAALDFYTRLFGWRSEKVEIGDSSYTALELGSGIEGGVVECRAGRPLWLPYVEVDDVAEATDRARVLGARVMLEPREGPAGWRSVISAGAGAEIALWQSKTVSER
jgi:predicted enzyme related to lactoylglutathione lyase